MKRRLRPDTGEADPPTGNLLSRSHLQREESRVRGRYGSWSSVSDRFPAVRDEPWLSRRPHHDICPPRETILESDGTTRVVSPRPRANRHPTPYHSRSHDGSPQRWRVVASMSHDGLRLPYGHGSLAFANAPEALPAGASPPRSLTSPHRYHDHDGRQIIVRETDDLDRTSSGPRGEGGRVLDNPWGAPTAAPRLRGRLRRVLWLGRTGYPGRSHRGLAGAPRGFLDAPRRDQIHFPYKKCPAGGRLPRGNRREAK